MTINLLLSSLGHWHFPLTPLFHLNIDCFLKRDSKSSLHIILTIFLTIILNGKKQHGKLMIMVEDRWRFSSISETVILQAKQQTVKWNVIVQMKNIIVHRQLPENILVYFLICRSKKYWTESLLNYNIYYSLY